MEVDGYKIPNPRKCSYRGMVYQVDPESKKKRYVNTIWFETYNEARYYLENKLPEGCFMRIYEDDDAWMVNDKYQGREDTGSEDIPDFVKNFTFNTIERSDTGEF